MDDVADIPDPRPGDIPVEREFGTLSRRPPNAAEKTRAKERRDKIAEDMWVDYQMVLAERGELLE